MNFYNTLKELCLVGSVSGRERKIREKIDTLISPLCDETHTDKLGNLIAVKRSPNATKKIALCAHMDEIGFLVNYIEDSGAIRISCVGGINLAAAAFASVVSENGVKGVIVPESGVAAKDFAADKFYIDIGAKNGAAAKRRVSIGDFFTVTPSLSRVSSGRIMGRPLDDRIGCAILLKIAEELRNYSGDCDIYYLFSTQEEVGCRGSAVGAFSIGADIALCFDVTGTGDTVGAKPMACALGDGAAIKVCDASVICDCEIVDSLCAVAKENGIKFQKEILRYGGTDTSSMQLAGAGASSGAISVPTRYIHSQNEMCDESDALACIALCVEYVKSL